MLRQCLQISLIVFINFGPAFVQRLSDERERWLLWFPVFLGVGIAVYFLLPQEPPAWLGGVLLVLSLGGAWLGRHAALGAFLGGSLVAAATGFTAIQAQSFLEEAPVLAHASGPVRVEGRLTQSVNRPGGGHILLEDVAVVRGTVVLRKPLPEGIARFSLIRLRVDTPPTFLIGERIALEAVLQPPFQPLAPGSFDFSRHAWFLGLGAVGSARGAVARVEEPVDEEGVHPLFALNRLRQKVTERILKVLPGEEGPVATALITGEMAAITPRLMEGYRDSGLAHLLSISGLHMSQVAALVFLLVRGGLALIPAIVLRYPIKKWAAGIALGATFLYLLLAGSPVPAQRSFIMTGCVLLAVLLDRVAITPRMVAWAGILVLLLAPEELIGPSFQMSFAAVAALVAAYEALRDRPASARKKASHWVPRGMLYIGGLLFGTLVAGTASAVYGIYHFNRFAVWSMVANLIAVPLTGVAVMPFALAALVLMPFGLESWALVPMGWGIWAVNQIALSVASWPGATFMFPAMPPWGLGVFTLGWAWLLIWRRSWRLWGLVPMALGLGSMALTPAPDLLVDHQGRSFAIRGNDGTLILNRGSALLQDAWRRRMGRSASAPWPGQDEGRLLCVPGLCRYQTEAGQIALVLTQQGVREEICLAKVVVSAVKIDFCPKETLVLDQTVLRQKGPHAVWLSDQGGHVESVADWQGQRPWSWWGSKEETAASSAERESGEGSHTGKGLRGEGG